MKEMGGGDDDDGGKVEIDDLAEKMQDLADEPEKLKAFVAQNLKQTSKMSFKDLNTVKTLARTAQKLEMGGPDVDSLQKKLKQLESLEKIGEDLKALVDSESSTKAVKTLLTEAKKAGLPETEYAMTCAAQYIEDQKPKDEMREKLRKLADKGDTEALEKAIEQAEQGVLGENDLEEFREILKMAANLEEAMKNLDAAIQAKDVEQLRITIPMVEKMKGDVTKAKAVLKEEEPKYEAIKMIAAVLETKDVEEMTKVLEHAKKVKVAPTEYKILEDFIKAFQGLEAAVAECKKADTSDEEALLKAKTKLAQAIKDARAMGVSETDLYPSETLRKKYHNMLEDLKGAIRVFCRVRPISQKEIDQGDSEVTKRVDGMTIKLQGDDSAEEFIFDAVWTPGTQFELFEDAKDLIQSAIDGFNVTIFAYGQTGAGKTFTMTGVPKTDNRGVIPRSCVELFDLLQVMEAKVNYTVELKMLELYNADFKDLLAKDKDKAPVINVRVDKKGAVIIEGVNNLQCKNATELDTRIDEGFMSRTTKATAMISYVDH